jgi:hypothetical protein
MTKRITLTALIVLLGTISGQAFAYSNVSPKEPTEVVSNRKASDEFKVFDWTLTRRAAEPDTYRYRGGPRSND